MQYVFWSSLRQIPGEIVFESYESLAKRVSDCVPDLFDLAFLSQNIRNIQNIHIVFEFRMLDSKSAALAFGVAANVFDWFLWLTSLTDFSRNGDLECDLIALISRNWLRQGIEKTFERFSISERVRWLQPMSIQIDSMAQASSYESPYVWWNLKLLNLIKNYD